MTDRPDLDRFARDLETNGGYLYSTNASLSSRLANRRCSEVVVELADPDGRRVVDIGCGDGTYTAELLAETSPRSLTAIDVVSAAVSQAAGREGDATYAVGSATQLPYRDDAFDVAIVRGVLHHMPDPAAAIGEALRVAPRLVVLEPNGYNPGLKAFERFHPYHRAHGEKSYPPRRLDRWVQDHGGRVDRRVFAGVVPMFCPDPAARVLKRVEPLVEAAPGLRTAGCAVYVFGATRVGRAGSATARRASSAARRR